MYDWWAGSYWSSYMLNWLVIPLIQEFALAGEFQFWDKMIRAILSNVPIYILYCISFIGLLIALFIHDKQYDHDTNIL